MLSVFIHNLVINIKINTYRNFFFRETQRAQKESITRKEEEGPLLKQKIARLKNPLGYQMEEDKVFMISNPDSTDTDSSSTVINSTDNAESSDNTNEKNPESSVNREMKETH